jgi:hypothetical protein
MGAVLGRADPPKTPSSRPEAIGIWKFVRRQEKDRFRPRATRHGERRTTALAAMVGAEVAMGRSLIVAVEGDVAPPPESARA